MYHSTPKVFQLLDDENIRVVESLLYYQYRATFDFECYFDTTQLPSKCLVTDGDPDKLVTNMMDILRSTSGAGYEELKDAYEDVFDTLKHAKTEWDDRMANTTAVEEQQQQTTKALQHVAGSTVRMASSISRDLVQFGKV